MVIALCGVGLLTVAYVIAELTVSIVSTQIAITSRELFTLWVALLILYFVSPSSIGIYVVSYSLARAMYAFSGVLNPTLYHAVTTTWTRMIGILSTNCTLEWCMCTRYSGFRPLPVSPC